MSFPTTTQRDKMRYGLLRQINEVTTFAGLIPPDIWSDIFLILAARPTVSFDDMIGDRRTYNLRRVTSALGQNQSDKDLRSVSQVCRLWREISIGHPELWSHINVNRTTRWLKMKALRTKNYGIRVSMADPAFTKSLSHTKQKVISLDIFRAVETAKYYSLSDCVSSALGKENGRYNDRSTIQSLMICLSGKPAFDTPLFPIYLPLRSQQPGEKAIPPTLKTIILMDCMIRDFSDHQFSGVTHLMIGSLLQRSRRNRSDVFENSVTNSAAWLNMLSYMPRLVRVHLRGVIKRARSMPPEAGLVLAHLEELSLIEGGQPGGVREFFYGITTPKACSLYLSMTYMYNDDDNYLVKAIKRWFSLWPQPLPDPGMVGIMHQETRLLIHNSVNPSGLRFQIDYYMPMWTLFSRAAMEIILPVLRNTTDLKIMDGKNCATLGFVFLSEDDWPFWKVRRLTAMEGGKCWRRKRMNRNGNVIQNPKKKESPFVTWSKTLDCGTYNLDFPTFRLYPALETIRYLPRDRRRAHMENVYHDAYDFIDDYFIINPMHDFETWNMPIVVSTPEVRLRERVYRSMLN